MAGLFYDPETQTLSDMGLFGPMTPRTRAGTKEGRLNKGDLPTTGERALNGLFDYGPLPAQMAVGMAMQPVRAGEAIGDAASDPSIGRIANAGAQTAMTFMQPAKAAGILLGGAGATAADQFGLFGSSAMAASLSTEQQARKAELQKQVAAGKFTNGADRRAKEAELQGLITAEADAAKEANRAASDAERQQAQQRQNEYSTAVSTAEALRNTERGRDTRWSDTKLGKYYNDTGGAPTWAAVFAGGAGMLDRLAKGAPKTGRDYGRLAAEGTGAASIPINAPLAYNAFATEPDNPQRRALEVYVRELPDNHPKKQYWADYALQMQTTNPVKDAAQAELYDPLKFAERLAMAGIEGAPSAMTGANIPGAMTAIGRGATGAIGHAGEAIGGFPASILAGHHKRMDGAATARGSTAKAAPHAPTAAADQPLFMPPHVKPDEKWVANSPTARQGVLDHVSDGGHLAAAAGSKQPPGTLLAKELHDLLPDQSRSIKTTQTRLRQLRDIVMANGVDPKTVTVEQIKSILDRLDPKYFAAPLAIGGVGAAATGAYDY